MSNQAPSAIADLPPFPDDDVYPRPQLRRKQWMSLDGSWRFLFDDEKRYSHPQEIEHWPLKIVVPYPVESQASGIGDRAFHLGCWYERDFDLHADAGGRMMLHFGAVDYQVKVWVNGTYMTSHEGGGHRVFRRSVSSSRMTHTT